MEPNRSPECLHTWMQHIVSSVITGVLVAIIVAEIVQND